MDNPDLIVTCVVGDGEAETGPTAAAWHSIKYLDPSESGAVIPILHVNGFKISERTIFGCMDNKELVLLFSGYGYQNAAREGSPITKPRWPMIILRSPKGWTGPRTVDNEIIEGSFRAHQVPVTKANKSEDHLQILQDWLQSYEVHQLLADGQPSHDVLDILPPEVEKRLGQLKLVYDCYRGLDLPDWKLHVAEKTEQASSMQQSGKFLDDVARKNMQTFRIFSPDELESNKLSAVLDHSGRNFQWDQYARAQGGRVIEILSEHCCQGFLQGYTLTGRTAIFPSYESFLGIIHTMMIQYAKFSKMSRKLSWRGDLSSINYIETSTWARQEHNGFSHQNPSFIGAVLNLKADTARVYLPPDANCFLSTLHHCLGSKNYVNLMIGSKQPTPVYLSAEDAMEHCKRGVSIWKFASTHDGEDPDVVLVGIGVEVTFEVIKAAELLAKLVPKLRVRVINVTDLLVLPQESHHPHALSPKEFEELFTVDKPVCFNYHSYATELQGLLFGRPALHRITVEGYKEEGSTTTPFDMMLLNGGKLSGLLSTIDEEMTRVQDYIREFGKDPDNIYELDIMRTEA
ncbi:hypothetical protein TrVFT333_007219 [Trichoderma virens FT-333]|nr:hypothetical protein TrVFT333_007219 [Trichoderma virens FT-333]